MFSVKPREKPSTAAAAVHSTLCPKPDLVENDPGRNTYVERLCPTGQRDSNPCCRHGLDFWADAGAFASHDEYQSFGTVKPRQWCTFHRRRPHRGAGPLDPAAKFRFFRLGDRKTEGGTHSGSHHLGIEWIGRAFE